MVTECGVALIGSGRMGAFHGETLARRIPARGWRRWPTRRRAAERLAASWAAIGVHRSG